MNEPSPIRGRWTLHQTSGTQKLAIRVLNALVDGPPLAAEDGPVEVVPVPDEQAIERAAKALEAAAQEMGWYGLDNLTFDEVARIALAALHDTDSPSSGASSADRSTNAPPVPPEAQ